MLVCFVAHYSVLYCLGCDSFDFSVLDRFVVQDISAFERSTASAASATNNCLVLLAIYSNRRLRHWRRVLVAENEPGKNCEIFARL